VTFGEKVQDTHVLKTTNEVQYKEILRRLGAIETELRSRRMP